MAQPVPYQSPLLQPGTNLITRPWYTFLDSLNSNDAGGSASTQISWVPEQGPVSPHGQEAQFPESIVRSIGSKVGERISVADFGAVGDGGTDDAPAFNRAIAAAIQKPGCEIYVPGGYRYLINSSIKFNGGSTPLTLTGDGSSSVILCGTQIANGFGFIDIHGSDVTIRNILIDGQKTSPDRLQYNKDFQGVGGNDPLAASLSQGTSIWIHAGCARIALDGLVIQHTRGYAVLLNATEGQDIWDCDIRNCWFLNNRPALFGISSSDLNYGCWNGGIMLHGDGRAGAPYMVRGLSVSNCHWRRCNGNALWSHLYGFASLHENLRFSNNDFVDNGLDCIQFGGVCGGVCVGNFARRVGYICSDDGATPGVPKWLNGAWASFLDTSGQVIGVDYCGNTGISINGDGINLDGYSSGTISGNTLRQPLANEPEYIVDQLGIAGFAGSSTAGGPNFAHGMLSSNTSNDLPGGDSIVVVGNTVLNFSCGAILLYAGRRCVVQSNNIEHPANATEVPIVLGNVGTGDQQRTYDSAVYGNRIGWKPSSPRPCIREDASLAPFNPGDSNHIGVNTIIPTSGNAYGFESATTSSSRTEVRFDSNQPGLSFPSYHYMQSEGAADTSVLRWWYAENLNAPAINMQLQSRYASGKVGPLLNVSSNGAAGSGVISTASKTNSALPDTMATGHFFGDGFVVLTDSTYADADANVFNTNQWALLRYRPGVGHLEQSISVSGGSRVWTSLGGDPGGPLNAVQLNQGGAFYGDINFTYNPSTQQLIVGDGSTSGSGVISKTFNAEATGSSVAFQTAGGTMNITGAGNGNFQNVIVSATFNSLATGTTPVIQQASGSFVIHGSGLSQFQQVIAGNIYAGSANSDGTINTINGDCFAYTFNATATGTDIGLIVNNGSAILYGSGNFQAQQVVAHNIYAGSAGPGGSIGAINGNSYAQAFVATATGGNVSFTNNGGSGAFAAIYGNGQLACQWIALGNQSSFPTPQAGVAFIAATSSGLFVSLNGGAYQTIGGGGISGVKTSDGAQYANSGGFAMLSFINSSGLINTSAISVSGSCNAGNYQINGLNGDTVNVSYNGLDGSIHTLSFNRGILTAHS